MSAEKNTKNQKEKNGLGSIEKSDTGKEENGLDQKEQQEIQPEVLDKLPRGTKKSLSMFMSGPMPHPIYSKIQPEHITKLLELTDKDNERDFRDKVLNHKWNFAWLVVIMGSIIAAILIFLYWNKSEYITPIITAIIAGLGGYGFGKSRAGRE